MALLMPHSNESLPSDNGLWLGLACPNLWLSRSPRTQLTMAISGTMSIWCFIVRFSTSIRIQELTGSLFIWIVCSTMLGVAWWAPGNCMSHCDSLLEFYPPQIPIMPEDVPDWIAQASRLLGLQLGLHIGFLKGGSVPCHSVSGLDIPKCEYAASTTCRSLPDTIFTSSGGSMRCNHLPLF